MMKWKMREQYEQQDERYNAVLERYNAAVIEAGTRLQDLKAEQAELFKHEFRTGANLTVEKNKLAAKIEAAEKDLAAAEHERGQAYEFRRTLSDDRITVRQLLLDWNGPYRSAVRENELQPIIDRLTAARAAYYNALLDVKELEARYNAAYLEMRDMAHRDNDNHPGNMMYPLAFFSQSDVPLISREDLLMIEDRRQLPFGIKRVSEVSK
ncbi:hypothetical protein [Paenibacillus cremeus]|uniref:Uncharacterized protein n=1 Tax=Paenibacillus cremeus TaxID=2163881 RepID=A0A559JMA7_9BACL|nr:hypothetical protein [Paenibacillus cremeus]TVY00998.1 hypothetical protein FPZ49_32925 [Paenibacillus cremeus]